jgi:hypothetical protein
MKHRWLIILSVTAAAAAAVQPAAKQSWDAFWSSVHVMPPPPPDFLEGPPFRGDVLNLTDGRLSDAAARRWVVADLRRGRGDAYATNNLRRDIADAEIFGPRGLNGTSESIDEELAKGTVRIDADGYAETIAAAVIWLSKEEQAAYAGLGHTDYVIVLERRMSGKQRLRILKDGTRQPLGKTRAAGQLAWQLDTGRFFNHPVLGPLWYQQAGWSCTPKDGTRNGEICGRLRR